MSSRWWSFVILLQTLPTINSTNHTGTNTSIIFSLPTNLTQYWDKGQAAGSLPTLNKSDWASSVRTDTVSLRNWSARTGHEKWDCLICPVSVYSLVPDPNTRWRDAFWSTSVLEDLLLRTLRAKVTETWSFLPCLMLTWGRLCCVLFCGCICFLFVGFLQIRLKRD